LPLLARETPEEESVTRRVDGPSTPRSSIVPVKLAKRPSTVATPKWRTRKLTHEFDGSTAQRPSGSSVEELENVAGMG
jgi:hypothetical protein